MSDPPSILDPAGPGAAIVESLWWPMLWISTGVFLVVSGLLAWAVLRGGRNRDEALDRSEVRWGEPFIAIAGVALPFLILAGVYILSLQGMNDLAERGERAEFAIEVIGRDWWWEVRYPNGVVTANEIHIPVGRVVRLDLTTKDVIHSFWVPELQVKTDQIPGRTNYTWLEADEPGRYRGQCAEFCGLQHANMVFYVVAQEEADYTEWVEQQARPAVPASGSLAAGEAIFLQSSCAGCHAIQGTEAAAGLGPDLTHLMSRDTIGGVFENDRRTLTRFVTDPHQLKPGVAMPPTELTADDIELLVDYLESLD